MRESFSNAHFVVAVNPELFENNEWTFRWFKTELQQKPGVVTKADHNLSRLGLAPRTVSNFINQGCAAIIEVCRSGEKTKYPDPEVLSLILLRIWNEFSVRWQTQVPKIFQKRTGIPALFKVAYGEAVKFLEERGERASLDRIQTTIKIDEIN